MTDLDKLIEAVEGEAEAHVVQIFAKRLSSAARDRGDYWPSHDVEKAFRGSLDAAKALHEALLPDTRYLVGGDNYDWPENTGAIVFSTPKQVGIVAGNNPARAWLLAILKAYRSLQ